MASRGVFRLVKLSLDYSNLAVPFLYTPFHILQRWHRNRIKTLIKAEGIYRMRNNKNNIKFNIRNITLKYKFLTFNLKNLISFYRNITSHLTDKEKILTLRFKNITLASLIIMLSFTNMTLCSSNIFNNSNVSALDYSSNVGIGFTFNPTLSISLSSNDLVIPNLVPGSIEDSNSINVSVATNAAYGYTLSANIGDDIHNNSNLTHTNNTSVFSSIATNADLSSLDDGEDTNIWGYSTSLDNSTTWSNYNGLANSNNAILLDTSSNVSNNIGFKIAAKASNAQPSGVYTGTINFYATTKPTSITLSEAYASEGKTMINGYYTMQDMTSTICEKTEAIGAQLQVLDIRDNKLYWISKLADNHCWMTQNLDLDLDSNRTYTHWDTDLGWSTEDGSTVDENATWKPSHSTIDFDGANTNQVPGWVNSNTEPYSANPGDIYYYTSGTEENDIKYNSLQECTVAGHNDCAHYHAGNYYNWSVAVGSNDTSEIMSGDAPDSVCPKGWRLPKTSTNDFKDLITTYDIKPENITAIRSMPVSFVRSGYINIITLSYSMSIGYYWSSTINQELSASRLVFNSGGVWPSDPSRKDYGFSVRCLAR